MQDAEKPAEEKGSEYELARKVVPILTSVGFCDVLEDKLLVGDYENAEEDTKILWEYICVALYSKIFQSLRSSLEKSAIGDTEGLLRALNMTDEGIVLLILKVKMKEFMDEYCAMKISNEENTQGGVAAGARTPSAAGAADDDDTTETPSPTAEPKKKRGRKRKVDDKAPSLELKQYEAHFSLYCKKVVAARTSEEKVVDHWGWYKAMLIFLKKEYNYSMTANEAHLRSGVQGELNPALDNNEPPKFLTVENFNTDWKPLSVDMVGV